MHTLSILHYFLTYLWHTNNVVPMDPNELITNLNRTNNAEAAAAINKKFVQEIERHMNLSANPCEDFYSYACGNWAENSSNSFESIMENTFDKLLRKTKAEKAKYNGAYRKALAFYRSCLNVFKYDSAAYLNVIGEPGLKQKWPYKSTATHFEGFNWWRVLAKLQSYGLTGILFDLQVAYFPEKSNSYVITLSENNKAKITEMSDSILKDLGYNTSVKRKLYVWELQKYETKLINYINEENETDTDGIHLGNNKTKCFQISESAENGTQLMTLSDLQVLLPNIDWNEYLKIKFQGTNLTLPNNLKLYTVYNVEAILRLMQFVENSSKDTLALYMWSHFLIYLESTLLSMDFEGEKCTELIYNAMPLAADFMYEEFFYAAIRNKSERIIHNIFQNLKNKLNLIFETNRFNLTSAELQHLKRKNAKIRLNIGNLPKNKTEAFLVDYYKSVNITAEHSFYHNHLALLRHQTLLEYQDLIAQYENPKSNELGFFDYKATTHARPTFDIKRNFINLPFPELIFPIFDYASHDVFYANLVFTLGHELAHGFDMTGIKIDENGEYNALMENITKKLNFQDAINCLREEITASIDERVADISGLRLTMDMFYKDLPTSNLLSKTLSNRKLFLLQTVQYFCRADVDDDKDLSENTHDPEDYRVIYMFANTQEFLNEFKCTKSETPISSEKICGLW